MRAAGWRVVGALLKARTWNVPSYATCGLVEGAHAEDIGACVVHNDWRFDNVVSSPDHPGGAVLDWELAPSATAGDVDVSAMRRLGLPVSQAPRSATSDVSVSRWCQLPSRAPHHPVGSAGLGPRVEAQSLWITQAESPGVLLQPGRT